MAFKTEGGIDFGAWLNRTPEEREADRKADEARRQEQELSARQDEISHRAVRSTQRLTITVEGTRNLPEYAKNNGVMVTGTKPDGERTSMVFKPLAHEDYDQFTDRFRKIREGDTISADGLYEQRRWQDQNKQWRSAPEFQALMPITPENLRLSERHPDLKHQPSHKAIQLQAAHQTRGQGR